MKAKLEKNIFVCNIICALLLVCLVASQFIPFWGVTLPDKETGEPVMNRASLMGVTGRQYVHEDLIERLCEITSQRQNPVGDTFSAEVLEVKSDSLLVLPLDGKAQQSADEIIVALPEGNTESYKIGDRLHIDYTDIDESDYPPSLAEVHAVDSCTFYHTYINTQVLLTVCLGAFAAFLCLRNSHGWFRAVLTLVAAGASASLWLLVPAYTLGLLGHILFALSAVLFLMGIVLLYLYIQQKREEKRERE